MDIEFHYYITYLIAARAGFSVPQALTIAQAAQGVDENHIKYLIRGAPTGDYRNYISQTMNILKPTQQLLRIYPIFHFIPGDPDSPTAARKDGRKDPWVTTPDSAVARKMIDAALASGDLYRIGVSAHGYVDTWAHQNFLGKHDPFNVGLGAGWLESLLAVGHGAAKHQPDKPALTWTDHRLVNETIENRERFLDAAEALYRRFALHLDPAREEKSLATECASLRMDIDNDIGGADPSSDDAVGKARIARYQLRSLTSEYGAAHLPEYDEYSWFNAAIAEDGESFRQKVDEFLGIASDYIDQSEEYPCTWRDPINYMKSDWYCFVDAVKAHQNACWDILVAEGLPDLTAKGM